jgi:hypothetical protein
MSTLVRRLAATALVLVLTQAAVSQQVTQRPHLPPGQTTNWTPHASLVGGLVTQNLVPGSLSPADLATTILGTGVTIQNVTFSGANVAAGTFQGGTGIIGFDAGIVLSSGNMNSIQGPNLGDATTTVNLTGGDPDLASLIPGYTVFDACKLEFDFSCPLTQVISFQFVFTSEEYNEWVNSPYNDVFGFFVNGQNIALVPGTANTPVSINNVNCNNPYAPPTGSHCSQFVNNDLDDGGGAVNTEMDGLTVLFTATVAVNPGFNHIKLAIADAGDDVLDSNVLIRAGSLTCGTPGPVCELPMPALELGAAPIVVAPGSAVNHPVQAIATNGLGGQQVTITGVTATLNGSAAALPPVTILPGLPMTGQPAMGSFAWTPIAANVGTWDFVYHLVDQLGVPGQGTVRVIVQSGTGYDDLQCFLVGSTSPAWYDIGGGDFVLVDLTNPNWFVCEPDDIPDFEIVDDPALLGLTFYLQVGLINPVVFPADPIKTSNGLQVIIGVSSMLSYGPTSGILLWSNTPPLLDTDFTVEFAIQ